MSRNNKAIVWLRCLAALLIINSHFGPLYPGRLSALAFGGVFGNCMFFALSAWCFAEISQPFPSWMAKRLVRLYVPFLIFFSLYAILFSRGELCLSAFLLPVRRYHFIASIVTLYPVWYLAAYIHKRARLKYSHMLVIALAVQLLYFYLVLDYNNYYIYQHYNVFELISYLCVMLLGASLRTEKFIGNRAVLIAMSAVAALVYLSMSVFRFPQWLTILRWYSSMAFVYGLSCLMLSMEDTLRECRPVSVIADMTLELYLVQEILISAFQRVLFPVNLLLCTVCIFALAYCLRFVSEKLIRKINARIG